MGGSSSAMAPCQYYWNHGYCVPSNGKCGLGTKTISPVIIEPPRYGGMECPGKMIVTCEASPCPSFDLGDYSGGNMLLWNIPGWYGTVPEYEDSSSSNCGTYPKPGSCNINDTNNINSWLIANSVKLAPKVNASGTDFSNVNFSILVWNMDKDNVHSIMGSGNLANWRDDDDPSDNALLNTDNIPTTHYPHDGWALIESEYAGKEFKYYTYKRLDGQVVWNDDTTDEKKTYEEDPEIGERGFDDDLQETYYLPKLGETHNGFTRIRPEYPDISDSVLVNSVFTNSTLSYVNLTNADLTGATLTNATLTGTTLSGATLTGADLTGIKSGNVTSSTTTKLPENWKLINGYMVGPKANLTGSTFSRNADTDDIIVNNHSLKNTNINLIGHIINNKTKNQFNDNINIAPLSLDEKYTISGEKYTISGENLSELVNNNETLKTNKINLMQNIIDNKIKNLFQNRHLI